MVWPPRASIECTDHMLIYGPSKPSSMPSIEGGFTHTASMVSSRREIGYGPVDLSAVVLWGVLGALLLGTSGSVHRC
jgi:hypothetical protein